MQMIQEWTPEQFTQMQKAIVKHFKGKKLHTHHGNHWPQRTFKQIDEIFGLAYTSTSKCAMYGVCNTNVFLDLEQNWKYSYFAIGTDGNTYAICENIEETELTIQL
jgi:hypothetical protein